MKNDNKVKNDPLSEVESQKEIDEVRSEESNLEQLLQEEKERRILLKADFENYKKRMESERATFGAIANMGLIQELLEVHDDLQLALDDSELDLNRSKESIKTAQQKLLGASERAGIERIEVKVGDEFNKETMEAISAIPNEENKNKVIAVISSAFKYRGQTNILKPAKVIVGK